MKLRQSVRAGILSVAILLVCVSTGHSQATIPATTQPTSGPSAVETLISQRVPGVRPDMTATNLAELAANAVKEHDLPVAQKIYAALVQQNPKNVQAMFGLGNAYEAEGQEARKSADADVARRAGDLLKAAAEWYLKAGVALFDASNFADAEH